MVFSLKDSSDSIGKPSPSLSPIISSTSTSTSLRNSCILENYNENIGNQTPINSSSNSINSSGRILLSQKQRSINISNEQSQYTQQQIQLQQTGNIESNDPNSPKYLTSSHSTVVIPQSPTPSSSSPLLQDLLSNGSGSDNGSSGNQSPFITSPKGPNSPRRLVGFFSKSTSYQSLLNKGSNSNGSNSTTTYSSNNGSISNSIHTSFNENEDITSSTSSSLVNSTTSTTTTTTTTTTTYSINNNNSNSPERQHTYSPSNKRLIRHEKSKSSPPLSPIIPNYYNSLLDNISKNNGGANNNGNSNNNNNSGSGLPFSLNKENMAPNSLIPNISALKLDNVSTSPNGTHIIFSNQPPVIEKDEKEREKDEKDLDNYINMINNSGFISNSSNDNSLISNGGTFSPIKEEISPLPSPSFSPKPTLTRTRSNSKNVLYSPNASPSNSCKLSTPSTPPLTPLTPPPLHNISIVESPTTTNNNIDTNNKTTTTNNNNIQQTPNNKLNTSNPINITNSTLKKSGNIDYLQINNNYVIPSPSPGTIGCNYPPVSIVDFTLIEKIGEGGFGQVFLAKKNDTGEIVAIKRMSKDLIWSKNKVSHIKNERDILAQGKNHRWIVSLVYSFQDDHYLYLAMEYVPGGDLRSLLSALSSLDEDSARFYMAEMVEAVDSCHRLGYCHRDLKPENFLISRNGHVKLADFGLSKNVITRYMTQSDNTNLNTANTTTPTSNGLSSSLVEHTPMKFGPLNSSVTDFGSFNKASKLAYSVVGSPFYMAPEVLQATRGYGDEVDWWSLGCMFYEFIFGVPPFDGDSPEEVMESVLRWKTMLIRPDGVSDQLWDLISGLINDGSTRLGSGELGVENIKNHVFFKDVLWGRLHELEPPFVPLLQDDYDTTYFENTEKIDSNSPPSLLGIQSISPPQSQSQPQLLQPPPTPTNNHDGSKKILDKIRSPIVYTNKHSGNIITSRSRPRNILGFTYPRAEDQPLLWNNNLLKNFEESTQHVESSSNNNNNSSIKPTINSIPIPIINNNDSNSSDEGSLTPTNQSPYNNNQVIQQEEPSSPYGSYSNNNPF